MSLSKIQAVAIISIMIMVLAVPAITENNASYGAKKWRCFLFRFSIICIEHKWAFSVLYHICAGTD
jgi:hypothetical protein